MADQDPPAPKPKKVYTPEEKAAILRSLRRTALILEAVNWVVAAGIVLTIWFVTFSVPVTAVAAGAILAYMLWHTYRQITAKNDDSTADESDVSRRNN